MINLNEKSFIDNDKLEVVLKDVHDLLFKKYNLMPLERSIVLKICMKREIQIENNKNTKKNVKIAKLAANSILSDMMGGNK